MKNKYYLNGKGERQMGEYGLIVHKVDAKGETVAIFWVFLFK